MFWLGMLRNACVQSGLRTLKLTVSREWADWTKWLFTCRYKLIQTKRWLKVFGVGIVKKGCGQCGDRTLKLTVSEEWTDGID